MQVIIAPDPKLRIKTKFIKKITPSLIKQAKEMIKLTEKYQDPEGVGLAAPQIGSDESFFIARMGKKFSIFINPQILEYAKNNRLFYEGCLSIPKFYGEVLRPAWVKVTYQNPEGKQITKKLYGTSALIFQHEYDHLVGKLFVDYILQQKGRMFKVVGQDPTGSDILEQVRL